MLTPREDVNQPSLSSPGTDKKRPSRRLGEIKEQHQKQLNTSTKARPKCTPKKAGALLCKQGPEGVGLDMKKAADSCPSKAASSRQAGRLIKAIMRALGRPLRREQVKARPAGLVEQKQCLKSPQGKTFKAREEECFKEKRKASCSVGAAAEKELPSSRSKSLA